MQRLSNWSGITLRSFITLGLITTLVGIGCKTKQERQAEELANKQKQVLTETQNDNSAKLKTEWSDRAQMYKTLAGEYSGSYIANENAVANINVKITMIGAPSTAELNRLTRESELTKKIDDLGLEVQIKESLASNGRFSAFCPIQNIKADFATGKIRADCSAQGLTTARRVYSFLFASGDLESMKYETPEQVQSRAAELGNDILSGRRSPMGGFRLSIILNPEFGGEFTSLLKRIR